MNILKTIILVFSSFVLLQSCYYDVEEQLYPTTGGCDTSNATLAAKVKPILQLNCYTCHSQANYVASGGNINLETYAGTNCLKEMATSGKLVNSINFIGAFPMPKGSTLKIDACNIKIIEAWVAKGSKDN